MTTTQATNIVDYKNGSATIDADGHVNETGHLGDYIDPAHQDILDLPPGHRARAHAASGRLPHAGHLGPDACSRTWRFRGAATAPPAWRDMDREGIDAAVLYPTLLLEWREDPAGFGALCRAYNDWLRDYCAADPNRLYGVGAVPLQDIPAAIAEMERSLEQLDFKAVFVRPAPYIGLKKLHDPIYDPFWDAAQSLGCPIGVHPYPMADMPNTVQLLALDDDSYGMPSEGLTLRQGLGNAMDMMMATGWFVAGGICERFPDLKVVILEGSGGWMPTMLERFDHQQKVFGNPYQQHAAVRGVPTPVLGELRPRRVRARVRRRDAGRRPDPVGVRLPAPRREDRRRRRGAARGDGEARRRVAPPRQRRERRRVLRPLTERALRRASGVEASPSARAPGPSCRRPTP